jgi:oligoendopeptidase F
MPLVKNDLKYTVEEANEMVADALKILGDEYISVMRRAFSEN